MTSPNPPRNLPCPCGSCSISGHPVEPQPLGPGASPAAYCPIGNRWYCYATDSAAWIRMNPAEQRPQRFPIFPEPQSPEPAEQFPRDETRPPARRRNPLHHQRRRRPEPNQTGEPPYCHDQFRQFRNRHTPAILRRLSLSRCARRPGQAPEVETPHGSARFCPCSAAAVRVAGDPDSCSIVEWTDGGAPLTLANPFPSVVARFRKYGCPEYSLAKRLQPEQYIIRRRTALR